MLDIDWLKIINNASGFIIGAVVSWAYLYNKYIKKD